MDTGKWLCGKEIIKFYITTLKGHPLYVLALDTQITHRNHKVWIN